MARSPQLNVSAGEWSGCMAASISFCSGEKHSCLFVQWVKLGGRQDTHGWVYLIERSQREPGMYRLHVHVIVGRCRIKHLTEPEYLWQTDHSIDLVFNWFSFKNGLLWPARVWSVKERPCRHRERTWKLCTEMALWPHRFKPGTCEATMPTTLPTCYILV